VCASTGVTLSAHLSLASSPIYKYGNEEQKKTFLKRLATGEALGAYALSEPGAGSDVVSMKMTATEDGDHYILNGSKVWITKVGLADIYVVFAKTDEDKRHKGITAFIVEKGTEGVTFGKKKKKSGIRSSPTTELIFENCRIPKENMLGEEGE